MSSIRSLASAHSTAGVAQRVLRARMAKKRQHPLGSTPMLSTMSAVDLVQRHNAVTSCPRSDAHRATLIQQELRLVTDVALDIIRNATLHLPRWMRWGAWLCWRDARATWTC